MAAPVQTTSPDAGVLNPPPAQRRYSLAGMAVFLAVVVVGYSILHTQASRQRDQQRIELLAVGSNLRERISHELGSVLHLTHGLHAYLSVRHKDLDRVEMEGILAHLHSDSRHARNFAVAVGHRVTYIYPLKGNENALGLNYPDLPDQWPDVKRVIDTGVPFLVGPVNLVQGGKGFIYRAPVIVNDHYWGLLSTVVDFDSLMNSVTHRLSGRKIDIALRGANGRGMHGDVFWGNAELFRQANAELVEVSVPGGKWVIALAMQPERYEYLNTLLLGLLFLLIAIILSSGAVLILRQRDQLKRLALYDGLTGLPNRHLIEDRFDLALAMRPRSRTGVCALLFVDLDGFKNINDQFGHKAGDAVLQEVARRLQQMVRQSDTVGRWGGDEMLILLVDTERARLSSLLEQCRRAMEKPIQFAGSQLVVGASIGLAIAPDDGDTLDDLIRAADHRMYENKTQRRASGSDQ